MKNSTSLMLCVSSQLGVSYSIR